MKKIIFVTLTFIIFLSFSVYALDAALLYMRNKIFDESQEIKPLITTSSDSVLLSSMWDTCIITMIRLDAYFFMLGIFNTIKEDHLTDMAFNFLTDWLKGTKNLNELNLKGLDEIAQITDPKTEKFARSLKIYFNDLNIQIDAELNKISLLKKSLKRR